MPADDSPEKNKFWAEALTEIKKCKSFTDKDKKVECIYDLLYKLTRAQDITNLTIRGIIDDDTDDRWIPIHIVDDANGIILGISRNEGIPQLILSEGYTAEKIKSLESKWFMLNLRRK